MKKKPSCIYVEWYDHASASGWEKTNNLDLEPLVCKTVGWVLKEDKNVMCIGSTMQENMGLDNSAIRTYVLKKDIRKRKVLR